MKEITETFDFTKIKNLFCERQYQGMTRQATDWGKKNLQETYLIKNGYLKYTKPLKTQP